MELTQTLEPTEALELWRSFIRDGWMLLDRYVRDGEEVIVACRADEQRRVRRPLTPRERDVVARVGHGWSNKLIAFELGISPATVASLLRRAIDKLGVASRLELVALLGRPGELER